MTLMTPVTPSHFTSMQRDFSNDGNNSDKYLMQLHPPQFLMLSEQPLMDNNIVVSESSKIVNTCQWAISKQWDTSPPVMSKFSTLNQEISVPNPSQATMFSSNIKPFEFNLEAHHNYISRNNQNFCPPEHPAFFPPTLGLVPPLLSPTIVHQSEPQLPIYSSTGFDILKMLLKVVTRPNARIMLGPVDMTCSFVVTDARHPDNLVVYASPTFCKLTGYPEADILGRNCRFLQSPTGLVQRGEPRVHTAPDVVRHFYRSLLQERECQASLINYRKDGSAFVNLVTLIPISEDDSGDITHFIGFQVDLAQQSGTALQKLRDGSYIVNYSVTNLGPGGIRDRRGLGVSNELIHMLRGGNHEPIGRETERNEIYNLVLDNVDGKGSLLYAASSIFRVLGYDAQELIGRSIADLCHPADVVPVMRELKDASSTPIYPVPHPSSRHSYSNGFSHIQPPPPPPRPTSLLFRALHKEGYYVWIISRGRLHVEPGKGRKAVVLVGRRINSGILDAVMSNLLETRITQPEPFGDNGWGLVASNGMILFANATCAQRLGFSTMPTIAPSHALLSTNASAHAHAHQQYMSSHLPDHCFTSQTRQYQSRDYPHSSPSFQGSSASLNFHSHIPATLVGRNLVSLIIPPDNQETLQALIDVSSGYDSARKIRCQVRGHINSRRCDETIPVEIRFYSSSTVETQHIVDVAPSVIFEMIFLPEHRETMNALRNFSSSCDTTLPGNMSIMPINNITQSQFQSYQNLDSPRPISLLELRSNVYSFLKYPSEGSSPITHTPIHTIQQEPTTSSTDYEASFHPSSTPQPSSLASFSAPSPLRNSSTGLGGDIAASSESSPRLNAELSVLSSLSTSPASETSWQYELTRLRFENERMEAELAKLERIKERGRRTKFTGSSFQSTSSKRPRNQELNSPG
ncbi:hypothetical protein Clacol_009138 [Clathrus columnatus]|uniref:PAS domain-containing protein n=1 Tax=Clathrus columnatus TaxID=1419009 RepID=A0AAV5ANY2_9AGAM|nr:hypothetical protein Clacol_009138 [Clathrus columnatus]